MQTSKARNGSSDVLHKTSPITPKSSRGSSKIESNSDSTALKLTVGKTSAERSPKLTNRRSPRSPVIEKKRPVGLKSDLEGQVSQLHDETKKIKDRLNSSQSSKKHVKMETEMATKQIAVKEEMHEDSQSQLMEFSPVTDALPQEFHKISQDRDSEWQSEHKIFQIQHSADSNVLTADRNEIQWLKQQQVDVGMSSENFLVEDSESYQYELAKLKEDMKVTLFSVATLQMQISEREKAEESTRLMLSETQKQLEIANATIESHHLEECNLQESLNSAKTKLEESRVRVSVLEEMVKKLHDSVEIEVVTMNPSLEVDDTVSQSKVVTLNPSLKVDDTVSQSKLEHLRAALEAAEVQTALQIQSAMEMAERMKSDAGLRELELESTLQIAKAELLETKASLREMETEFLSISQTKKELEDEMERVNTSHSNLEIKLMKVTTNTTELKADLLDKETELQSIMEENEHLKLKLSKIHSEHQKNCAAIILDAEKARTGEQEALRRIDAVNWESEKNNNKAAKLAEQLEAAQTVKLEMEVELKRLRVQSDQWRKAAEAAAAVLTPGNNGKLVGKMGSCDSESNPPSGKILTSPFSDDLNDESPKKKNGNVLKKIGGLLKKGPK